MKWAINRFVSTLLTMSLTAGCNPVFTDASSTIDGPRQTRRSFLAATSQRDQGGRILTILLTLKNPSMAENSSDVAFQLINNGVNWVSGQQAPAVLVVRDNNHRGESVEDPGFIHMTMLQAGFMAEFLEEPTNGLSLKDIAGYDVVWFSNPGNRIDDLQTVQTLTDFVQAGGGLVLQGDDVSQPAQLQPLTQLQYVDNGTSYCGVRVDNNKYKAYQVQTSSADHPVIQGIQNIRFAYGDDIDSTKVIGQNATVLAWANVDQSSQPCPAKPVIVASTYSQEPIVQAEEFSNCAGCRVASEHNNFSGSGFVDMGGKNSWIEMTIKAATTGMYTMSFRYTNGASRNRPCDIGVNGHIKKTAVFRPTPSWSHWRFTNVTVKLYQGKNRIRVWANTYYGGPNIDRLEWNLAQPESDDNNLITDDQLGLRDFLVSPNGQYRFTLQGDGNLVLRHMPTKRVGWAAHTCRKGGRRLILQKDGNLVLYRKNRAIWASHTVGSGASVLKLSNDGTLALYRGKKIIWSVD